MKTVVTIASLALSCVYYSFILDDFDEFLEHIEKHIIGVFAAVFTSNILLRALFITAFTYEEKDKEKESFWVKTKLYVWLLLSIVSGLVIWTLMDLLWPAGDTVVE